MARNGYLRLEITAFAVRDMSRRTVRERKGYGILNSC